MRPGAQYGRNAYSSTIRIHSIRTRAELWEFRDVNYRVSREVSAVDIKAFQKAGLLHNYRLPTFGLNFLYLCRHSKNAALLVSQLETPSNNKLIRVKANWTGRVTKLPKHNVNHWSGVCVEGSGQPTKTPLIARLRVPISNTVLSKRSTNIYNIRPKFSVF